MRMWIAFAALLAGCLPGMSPRPIRQSSVVYVDEAEQVRAALARAWFATALVKVEDSDDGWARGSGALIGERGPVSAWMLTAAHVVVPDDGAVVVSLTVSFPDGRSYPGSVWRVDQLHDLAVLDVLGEPVEPTLRLAEKPPRIMDRVWNVGEVDGYVGQVGGGRWAQLKPARHPPIVRQVTGAFFWPGMSGGPVVDERGDVVGVSSAVHAVDAPFGDDDTPQVLLPQMGVAVDWADIRDFLKDSGVLK